MNPPFKMPSGSRRDGDSEEPRSDPKADSSFIKLQQYVDSKIGAVLQGLVGLPSAFAKNTSRSPDWAVVDEPRKQKDLGELLEFTEGAASVSTTSPSFPLYSPITKSLFQHLEQRGDTDGGWKPANFMQSVDRGLRPECWPFKLRPQQRSTDVMKNLQYMAYNELNCSPNYASDYSLMPYLLFSPYSPLKLSLGLRAASGPYSQTSDAVTDNFPYCEAFEDLIRITHGQRPIPRPFLQTSRIQADDPGQAAQQGMAWIHHLYESNILQQKELKSLHQRVTWPVAWLQPRLEKITAQNKDALTELEMYDHFLRWTSSASSVTDAVRSAFNNPEEFLQGQLKALESPESKKVVDDLLGAGAAKAMMDLVADLNQMKRAFKDDLDELEKESEEDNIVAPAPKSNAPVAPMTPSTDDPNKVIATSTTTEHRTNVDGSAETTVTVWKRFADGRESVTTRNHCEDRPRTAATEDGDDGSNKHGSGKNPPSKGWFWS